MERERSEKFFVDLPEIQTERLLLRKVTPGDAEDMLAYISDPEVARHTTWEPYDSIEQVRDHLRSVISNYERGEPANWGVTLRESGRLIGMCGFMAGSWEPEYARASLGYAIAREYWDRGLTTEAVRAAIAFGFRSSLAQQDRSSLHRREHCLRARDAEDGHELRGHAERLRFPQESVPGLQGLFDSAPRAPLEIDLRLQHLIEPAEEAAHVRFVVVDVRRDAHAVAAHADEDVLLG